MNQRQSVDIHYCTRCWNCKSLNYLSLWVCVEQHLVSSCMSNVGSNEWLLRVTVELSYVGDGDWLWHEADECKKSVHFLLLFESWIGLINGSTFLSKASTASVAISRQGSSHEFLPSTWITRCIVMDLEILSHLVHPQEMHSWLTSKILLHSPMLSWFPAKNPLKIRSPLITARFVLQHQGSFSLMFIWLTREPDDTE